MKNKEFVIFSWRTDDLGQYLVDKNQYLRSIYYKEKIDFSFYNIKTEKTYNRYYAFSDFDFGGDVGIFLETELCVKRI